MSIPDPRATEGPEGLRTEQLLRGIIDFSSTLDMETLLDRLLGTAVQITGASVGALHVVDERIVSTRFFAHGPAGPEDTAGQSPSGRIGILGRIAKSNVIRLGDIHDHPAYVGLPAGHPPIKEFLGAPLYAGNSFFANLYVANKTGGFTDADTTLLLSLVQAAAPVIENARRYRVAQRQQQWQSASQEIITMLLSGVDEEDALESIAARTREIAEADIAALILPGVDDQLLVEIADGPGSKDLIGVQMPVGGRSHTVLTEGIGMIVDSLTKARTLRVPELRGYGPALYAPLRASGKAIGVLLLIRREGRAKFESEDLSTAEAFASQAALGLVLTEARHVADVRSLLDERARIARDLHDLAIQQLFATGIQLENLSKDLAEDSEQTYLREIITSALDGIDGTVGQIRQIIHGLRATEEGGLESATERLRTETSRARASLGFAPSLLLSIDDELVDPSSARTELFNQLIDSDLADDIVAVAREGISNAARHAGASSVAVTLRLTRPNQTQSAVGIEVTDDGVGIDPNRSRSSGLQNLASRARRHRGWFDAGPRLDGNGTRILWTAPLN